MNCAPILALLIAASSGRMTHLHGATTKILYLHSNGDNGPGLRATMDEANFTSLPEFSSCLWNMLESGPAGLFMRATSAPQVFNSVGIVLKTWADFYHLEHVYIVPFGSWFMWPAVAIGHKVSIPESILPPAVPGTPITLETISLYPRAFKISNFLTPTEAAAVIAYNEPRLSRSKVGAPSPSNGPDEEADKDIKITEIRTSYNAFDSTSPTADVLIKRSYNLLRIPYNNATADGLQLVKYANKQAYDVHTDYFPISYRPPSNFDPLAGGSNRYATIFMYLTTVEEGGETVFPHASRLAGSEDDKGLMDPGDVFPKDSWEYQMVKLCRSQLSTKAIMGEAVLFYSQTPNGVLDPYSEHGGCPVLKGDKWGANVWVWNGARITMRSSYHATFVNKLPVEVALYFFLHNTPHHELMAQADRTIEFLDHIPPGESKAFKCNSHDTFMAKTVGSDSIVNLYEIPDKPARGPQITFAIENLNEGDAIKRARTYEFMKGFELGYRGGHARGLEEALALTEGLKPPLGYLQSRLSATTPGQATRTVMEIPKAEL